MEDGGKFSTQIQATNIIATYAIFKTALLEFRDWIMTKVIITRLLQRSASQMMEYSLEGIMCHLENLARFQIMVLAILLVPAHF